MKMLLILLFIVTAVILFDISMRIFTKVKYLHHIPIVSNIPVVGCFLELSSFQPDNLHEKFAEYTKRYGKSFYARIFNQLVVVTSDTEYVDPLLSSPKHIRKNVLYKLLDIWLGNGLLLSQGHVWQKMRKIITPTFHFKILEEFVEVFDMQTDILVEKLKIPAKSESLVDIYPLLGLLTMDIITETAMGVQINAQQDSKSEFVQAVKEVTNILATRFVRPHLALKWLYTWIAPKMYSNQMKGIAVMHEFTERIIRKRRSALETAGTSNINSNTDEFGIKKRMALLDVLLQSHVDNLPLTDTQIRDEVNTFMFEGHDTTTSAIAFCLYLLSRHPVEQKNLYEEIRAHFGDNLKRSVTYQDLLKLNYLNLVVKESLRIFPPIPAIGRWLIEDLVIGDICLPAGTNIIILLWQILRDPKVFEEPERFWPERYLHNNQKTNNYSNIPFSAGPRNCIGQRFALFEMKTVIVKILRQYELFELGEPIVPSIKLVLRSKSGVQFGIRNRSY